MDIFYIFIICVFCFTLYYTYFYIENFQNKYCYGNVFCENQGLCISQRCLKCGLRAPCTKNSDCGPNNCINGCCDNM